MGLSTTYANVILAVITLLSLTATYTMYSDYLLGTSTEIMVQGERVKEYIETSVSITSVTTSGNNVIFLVVNDGSTKLKIDCVDFYIDRNYIDPVDYDEYLLLDNSFDVGMWNPKETLKMRTEYDIDDSLPHEGRINTCNGVGDSIIFYD